MGKGKLIIISAPSGCGKSTIIGEIIKNVLPNSDFHYDPENSTYKETPLYYYDNIKTFKEAFSDITRKNGWLGFNNPTTVYIPIDDNGYSINKCINNIEGCEFIDMTPERDLFYFTPKKKLMNIVKA